MSENLQDPIFQAAEFNNWPKAKQLLNDPKIDIAAINEFKESIFTLFLQNSNMVAVWELAVIHPSFLDPNQNGNMLVLNIVSHFGFMDDTLALARLYPEGLEYYDENNYTPAMYAAVCSSATVLELAKINPQVKTQEGIVGVVKACRPPEELQQFIDAGFARPHENFALIAQNPLLQPNFNPEIDIVTRRMFEGAICNDWGQVSRCIDFGANIGAQVETKDGDVQTVTGILMAHENMPAIMSIAQSFPEVFAALDSEESTYLHHLAQTAFVDETIKIAALYPHLLELEDVDGITVAMSTAFYSTSGVLALAQLNPAIKEHPGVVFIASLHRPEEDMKTFLDAGFAEPGDDYGV